jgi:MFS family permease
MPNYTALLRGNRAFRWLLGGSSLSMLGSRLTAIAYPMLILYLHGSAVMAGLAVFAANAPSFLVYIPAGALVDRWNPRWTLVIAEAGRGIAIGLIVTLLLLHRATVPLVIGAAILEESLEVFAMLAERRYVRVLVDPEHAPSALVSIETRTHLMLTVGRALGGLLFGIAQVLPFLADMLSFVASVSSLLISKPEQIKPPVRERNSKLATEVRDGLRALLGDPFARDATLLSASMTLLSQALIIVFLAAAHSREVSSVAVGIVLAASGIGGVAGAVAKPVWRLGDQSALRMQPVVWATMLALLSMSGRWQVPMMAIAMAVLGFSGALSNVELDSHLFVHVSLDKQARVASIGGLIEFAACAIGPAFGGVITERFGAEDAVWLLFFLTLPCVLFGLRLRVPERTLAFTGAANAPVGRSARSGDTLQSQGTSV